MNRSNVGRRPATLLLLASALLAAAAPASAHAGNRVQLYAPHFVVEAGAGAGSWQLHMNLVDADSGRPAPGFDVVASGTDGRGTRFEPVALTDSTNTGQYSGEVNGQPGTWSVSVQAKERPGGNPAVPFSRTWHVVLNPGSPAQTTSGGVRVIESHARELKSQWVSRLLLASAVMGLAVMVIAARRWRRLQVTP